MVAPARQPRRRRRGPAEDKPGLVHGAHLGVGLVLDAWLANAIRKVPFNGCAGGKGAVG